MPAIVNEYLCRDILLEWKQTPSKFSYDGAQVAGRVGVAAFLFDKRERRWDARNFAF